MGDIVTVDTVDNLHIWQFNSRELTLFFVIRYLRVNLHFMGRILKKKDVDLLEII